MAEKLPRCAHNYRTGILGYMMFAGLLITMKTAEGAGEHVGIIR